MIQVTARRAAEVAATLPIGLGSHGVCPACLSFVCMELESGDGRKIAGEVTRIAPTLWDEGLGDEVARALERVDAPDAAEELAVRGFRSMIFHAVVRRLAELLDEDIRRTYAASLN